MPRTSEQNPASLVVAGHERPTLTKVPTACPSTPKNQIDRIYHAYTFHLWKTND